MSELRFNRGRLQDLMDKRELVDADLAALAGLSKSTIYYLRTGKHKSTSAEKLKRIADALETTPEYLMRSDEETDDKRVPVLLPEPIRRLAQIAGGLSDVRQEELIRLAEALEKLEREQPVHALPTRIMEILLEVAGELGIESESLDELEELLRRQPPARLVDLGPIQPVNDLGHD